MQRGRSGFASVDAKITHIKYFTMTQEPQDLNTFLAAITQSIADLRALIEADRLATESDRAANRERTESDRAANRERFEQMQQYVDSQSALNAELRVRQEIQSQQIDGLIQVAEATLNSVQQLRDEFRQHRSDNHGA